MTLLYIDSFDHYVYNDVDITIGQKQWDTDNALAAPTVSAGNGRNSTASLRLSQWNQSGSTKLDSLGNIQTWIVGFALRFSALPSSTSPIIQFKDAANCQVHLAISSTGVLSIVRNIAGASVQLGTSGAFALAINTYYYVEVKVKIDGATGTAEVKIDGTQRINLTGQNTQVSANAYATTIALGDDAGSNGAANIDFDDLYVCDINGSLNNDFLGDCRVVALLPDGNGATNQWTPTAGSNFQNVDENPPDAGTTLVSETTLNDVDLYTFPSSGLSLPVKGLAVWNDASRSGANGDIQPISRPGSTNYFGAASTLANSSPYSFRGAIFETNGDTAAAWTAAEIDAAQFGVGVSSAGGGTYRVTQCCVEILFSSVVVLGNLLTQYVVEAIVQSSGALPNARLTQYVVELIRGTGQTPGEPCAPTTSQQQTYPPCYGAEFDTYIAPDGHTYNFHVARGLRFLMTEEGFGMPAIQYITSVGPYQHGETVRDWFLQPRIIQLMISNRSTSRQLYTAERAALLDAIRPNRQLTDTARERGVLRKRLSDGSIRDLKVLIESGPGFGPRDLRNWDEYRFQEILRFIAHDPVLYNPSQQCRSFLASSGGGGSPGSGGGTQLIFPTVFPITFGIGTGSGGGGSSSGGLSGTLQYNGTWEEYPQIVIHGPVISPVIENTTTGERLALETEILEGETVTFDLTYATKTVTKNDGTNMLGFLSDDSDLATFHLTTINNGANEIVISGSGTNAAMFVEFYYYERYIGR